MWYYAGNVDKYSILVYSIYMETEKRFNRMIGQLKGIQKMIVEKRNVTDVLQQISAVKKALDGLSKELVIENLDSYIFKSDTEKMKQIVERVINL